MFWWPSPPSGTFSLNRMYVALSKSFGCEIIRLLHASDFDNRLGILMVTHDTEPLVLNKGISMKKLWRDDEIFTRSLHSSRSPISPFYMSNIN